MKLLLFAAFVVMGLAVFSTVGFPMENEIDIPASPSDLLSCAKVALILESCWKLGADLPTCDGKSHLQMCAQFALKNASTCQNDIMKRFFTSAAKNYLNSDNILCQNNLYQSFLKDLDCWVWARMAATTVVFITDGLLTSDGCKASYLSVELIKIIVGPQCGALIGKYIDPLFKSTACGTTEYVDVETITSNDV